MENLFYVMNDTSLCKRKFVLCNKVIILHVLFRQLLTNKSLNQNHSLLSSTSFPLILLMDPYSRLENSGASFLRMTLKSREVATNNLH